MPRNNKDFRMPLSKDINKAWVDRKITGEEAEGLQNSNPYIRGHYKYQPGSDKLIKNIHKKAGLSDEE